MSNIKLEYFISDHHSDYRQLLYLSRREHQAFNMKINNLGNEHISHTQ